MAKSKQAEQEERRHKTESKKHLQREDDHYFLMQMGREIPSRESLPLLRNCLCFIQVLSVADVTRHNGHTLLQRIRMLEGPREPQRTTGQERTRP